MSRATVRSSFIQITISVVAAWAIAAATLAGAAPPRHAQITYELRDNGASVAQVVDRFQYGGGKYYLVERWKGSGLYALLGRVKRISRGTIGLYGLRPLEYLDERTGRPTARAVFNWKAHTLTLQDGGAPKTRSLLPDTQDKLSLPYAFAFHPPGGEPVTVHATDGRGVVTYVYESAGHHEIRTPAGVFETLKLIKRKDGPGDDGTEIWLAIDHGNLPVRILVTKHNGTRYDEIAARLVTQ